MAIVEPTLVTYRAAGIGVFGVLMRYAGMPLEKIALFMNSSQVSGSGQFNQALRLTFKDGFMAPYRVVGPASITAWFFQYSVMGFAFQFFDHGLSKLLGVKPVYYGQELMLPPVKEVHDINYSVKSSFKTLLSPILAAALETQVSNRAEVQRYFGRQQFAQIERSLMLNPVMRSAGPAFAPCMVRNLIMCQTTFVMTPITYKLYFPQEYKNKTRYGKHFDILSCARSCIRLKLYTTVLLTNRNCSRSLFWYGLAMNIFGGNVIAITQQALWGRSLDYLAKHGQINYSNVVREGYQKEGLKAFFTGPKWFSRVLMNAPAQGVLPWFYNEILPLGEDAVMRAVKVCVYDPFLREMEHLKEELNETRAVDTSTASLKLPTSETNYTANSDR